VFAETLKKKNKSVEHMKKLISKDKNATVDGVVWNGSKLLQIT